MARSIFVSFHYQRDISRVNIVRNHYLTKGTYTDAGYWDHSLWEETKRRGDPAIERMISNGLKGTSVSVILIGAETSSRKWVRYEILQSIARGNGFLGIYIHNIKNFEGDRDIRGANPLSEYSLTTANGSLLLSSLYPSYDWISDNGYNNFEAWVERAALIAGK